VKFLILAFTPVFARCVCSIIFKQTTTAKDYLFIFVMSLILALTYVSVLESSPYDKYFDKECVLTNSQRKEYKSKMDDEWHLAVIDYVDAEDACWYWPRMNNHQKAENCMTAAWGTIASLCGSDPRSKVVGALIATLSTYGYCAMKEWNYVERKLRSCEAHFELYDFYMLVLEKG